MMRTHALIDYMKVRADVEEAVWDLPDEYFEELFDLGVRSFYGGCKINCVNGHNRELSLVIFPGGKNDHTERTIRSANWRT